jgi:hypothetical protein
VIWEIEQDVQNNAGDANDGLATFYSYDLRGDMLVDSAFHASYNPGDRRKALWYYEKGGALYTSKWSSASQNLPVVRLAEMYLTRAECNLRLGTNHWCYACTRLGRGSKYDPGEPCSDCKSKFG